MLQSTGRNEAIGFLQANSQVEHVDMMVSDLSGVLRGKRYKAESLEYCYQNGVLLPGSVFALDATGGVVAGTGLDLDEGDRDRFCLPVPRTLVPVPWRGGQSAQALLTMFDEDGSPFFCDPRQVLASVVGRFAPLKLSPVVAVELEFYLLDRSRGSKGEVQAPVGPHSGQRLASPQVYAISRLDEFYEVLDDIMRAAECQNIDANVVLAEYAPGHYEVNLAHRDDPMVVADQAVMLKRLVKGVAAKHDQRATFMARPFSDGPEG